MLFVSSILSSKTDGLLRFILYFGTIEVKISMKRARTLDEHGNDSVMYSDWLFVLVIPAIGDSSSGHNNHLTW